MATKAVTVAGDFAPEEDATEQEKLLAEARPIISRLDGLAREQVRLKSTIEKRWVEDLRLYHGKYDSETQTDLENDKRSTAFIKLTRHKTNSWSARLFDLLFPTDEKNWGIKPTPLPELAKAAKEAVRIAKESVDGANKAAAKGNPEAEAVMLEQADAFAQAAQQTEAEVAEAKARCDNMEKAIEDQLVECLYHAQCRDVIEDGCKIGTGILKGPLTSQKLRREWRQDDALGGSFQLREIPDPMPEFKRVDPWHFFPDMSASSMADCEFTFERHLVTKKDLRKLAMKLGFSRAAVRRLLKEGATDASEDTTHIADLRALTGEGEQIKDRFVMWEFHGALECDEVAILLRAAGRDEDAREYEENEDPLEEYRVILYFCGNELLKISPEYPLDSGDTLYSVWCFEKGEASIFGVGVPHLMGDSQRAANGAWRMMLDNAALSVGPQIVIDKNAIAPQQAGDWGLTPLKVWVRSSTAMSTAPNYKPFETFDIPNNQAQLAGIIELSKIFIDEEVSMPTIAQGEQGAASQTLGGMSILFNSANVVFRRVVKSFDDNLTTPTLRRAYDWNMQFNPDETIKGDMQVDARGTSVLLIREIQSQNLLNIVTNWSVHQVLAPWIKVREAMEKALQTMMITPDDVLRTQDEFDRYMAELAAQPQPPDPNQIKLQIATETNESRERVAQLETDAKVLIAERAYDSITAKIAQETGLTQQEIEAKYGLKREEIASKERVEAVKIAVEDRRAKEAKAAGRDEVEATGQGIG